MNRNEKIKQLKKEILTISYETGEGHVPTAFSILDILYVLYNDVMNIDPNDAMKKDRDYCIVSKGHAAIGLYAILADRGFFTKDELVTFGQFNSRLGGHPDYNKVPGVEASTGSLGHGLPMAVGIAMGLSIQKSNQKVYCILGDGETNEGSIWEAVLLAGQHELDNLICIFDYNHSIEKYIKWGDMEQKFNDFGWATVSINGHDHEEIRRAVTHKVAEKPLMVIANTIKGFGCETMENDFSAWHHRSPSKEELDMLIKEIGD